VAALPGMLDHDGKQAGRSVGQGGGAPRCQPAADVHFPLVKLQTAPVWPVHLSFRLHAGGQHRIK
jgi:hypothetical protein